MVILVPNHADGQAYQLTADGGLTGTRTGNTYTNTVGNANALGIGTPPTGFTAYPTSTGTLYYTPYGIAITGAVGTAKYGLTAYISTNFSHPAASYMESSQSCTSTTGCTASQFSVISTNSASPTWVIPSPGVGNTTVYASIGIFMPDNDGASAFTGTDAVAITYNLINISTGAAVAGQTQILQLNGEVVQDAVQLTLSQAAGGIAITSASDYSATFGNVNGLELGRGPT